MATKAKNVRMTKANIKMLNYILKLEQAKHDAETFANLMVKRGDIKEIWENFSYKSAANQWHYAIEMFKDVNGLDDHDYFHGNAYGYIYDLKHNDEA